MAEAAESAATATPSSTDTGPNNADVLTKYKTAAQIAHKVLESVEGWCQPDTSILHTCIKGDELLDTELLKVYKGKKITKGIAHPTTVSPSSYVTPFTPLASDGTEDAEMMVKKGEVVKVQLGAQIDGYGVIVGDSFVVGGGKERVAEGREADLLLATYWGMELLLRLMVPPGLLSSEEDKKKAGAASAKAPTQTKINSLLEKVAKSYECNVVQNTTSWQFERNEIEAKKRIILSPQDGMKGEGIPEVNEVWGVEVEMSLGSGKVKNLDKRATLHRRTGTTYSLKRPSSRQILSEIVKKFGTFAFSLRQLEDERAAKIGVVECVRSNVLREYKPAAEADGSPIARFLTTIAITKNGITRLAAPPPLDLEKIKSDKKITDEEILKILEQPLSRSTGAKKNKKKKKKPKSAAAKKVAADDGEDDDEDEDSSDDE